MSLRWIGALMLLSGSLTTVSAQVVKPAEPALQGKLTAIETKGKTTRLTVDVGTGSPQTFDVTSRTELQVLADGDNDFLIDGMAAELDCIQSVDKYFAGSIRVYPTISRKPTGVQFNKPPSFVGTSKSRVIASGMIAKLVPDADEKYDGVSLYVKGNSPPTRDIYLEKNRSIKVVLSDPELLEVGQSVAVDGRMTAGKFVAARVVVQSGKKLAGKEYLPTLDKKK